MLQPAAKPEALRRLTWVAGAVLVWAAAIFLRLLSLQVVHHSDYLQQARQQQEHAVEIPAPRGAIFDRNGRALAMSVPMDSVSVNPMRLPDLGIVAEILAGVLDLDRRQLYGRLKWAAENRKGFVWVKRKISPEESERLRSLNLEWIEFQTESQRHYPKGRVAAHVLGSVDHQEKGNAGLERALDKDLRGVPGKARILTDVRRRGIDSQLASEARPGVDVTLTIDERIQFVAEREIARAVEKARAETGSVVVMNPYTGDILAMASYPTFDPNVPPRPGENPKCRFNQALSVPFEPGSVFKVFTLSSALETTSLRPDTLINCGGGAITLFGRTIHEAKRGFGIIPMSTVLSKSSNVGAIQIGMRVGQQNLYEYVRRFGFGRQTGLPLPAESGGMLRKLSRWGKTSLSSVAMGHEISTTTLQLAQACSVVANGGLLVRPRLVLKRGSENPPRTGPLPQRVLNPETAITMRQMMEGVVLPGGTGTRARLDGYTCGGKTGSAQIFDFAAKHYTHNYNASFMGMAPLTNPAIVAVVTVNGTRGSSGFGGAVAAPVFKAVATEALRVLDIPKDLPEDLILEPAKDQSENDLAIAELSDGPNILEEEGEEEEPVPADSGQTGPRVPNFRGKTMRAVLEEAGELGMPVLLDGSGVARLQTPPAGAVLTPGEPIRVQFTR